jgi:hypothetical protein
MHETLIRAATLADAPLIAGLHAASWRSTYRGQLPDAYLDHAVDRDRLLHWRAVLADPRPDDLVLLHGSSGFAAVRGGTPGFGALLDNLHVDPLLRGGGIGAALLAAVARRLAARGEAAMHLWVFDANARAEKFYRRHGAVADGCRTVEFFGAPVPETRLVFRDLAGLGAYAMR